MQYFRWVFILSTVLAFAQLQPPPIMRPPRQPDMGMPVPEWLGRGKTVTGHLEGVDPDRMLMKSLDYGTVLFAVDEKTNVHVDKFRLALSDLRAGDAVAVKLKEIKGKGPYALEIMAHPDVRRRKEHPGDEDKAVATPIPGAVEAERAPAAATAPAAVSAARVQPAADSITLPIPALPSGQRGVTGTVTEVKGEQAKVQLPGGRVQEVLVTTVTRIVRASGRDDVLDEIHVGDKVAVIGDTVDSGLLVAREILVNRLVEPTTAPAAAAPAAAPAARAENLSSEFTGTIASIDGDTMKVRTASGKVRDVLVTPVATIKRWNADVPFSVLRVGDEVSVKGDVLDDGLTIAREVIVTKTK
jgi:Cu/Ag efflux protein CusF